MAPETAFKKFESTANADPERLADARLRRDAFVAALGAENDVERARAIGSLARKTQKAPLNDVDIVVVYDSTEHAEWGSSALNAAAADAIAHTADRIKSLLGPDGSSIGLLNPEGGNDLNVRLVRKKRHSVKCFLDKAGEEDAFTVDVVPAISHPERGLWIPERNLDNDANSTWIRSDPEHLIACAEAFQNQWNLWIPCVRLLKYWNSETDAGMSSLYVEVLAHTALPINDTRTRALARFFQAAEYQISSGLADPAGLCGAIQPDLDVDHARQCLVDAAELAWKAVTAEADDQEDDAVCAWRALLGEGFPAPPNGCIGSVAALAAAGVGADLLRPKPKPAPPRIKDSPQG